MLTKFRYLDRRGRSQVFDAASSSGMAFLSSQLELPNVDLVTPLASVTHGRDIPIKTGGGFVEQLSAYQSDYRTTGGNQYGLQGTANTDVPQVQASVGKGLWRAWNWAASMLVTYIDLKRLADAKLNGMPAPFSLQDLLDDGIKLIWNKALDHLVYIGWAGQPGLMNNPNVVSVQAPLGAVSGQRTWALKTPVEILADVNAMLLYTQQNSGYALEGLADTILVNFANWGVLNQPMTTGGFSSVLEYILKNNIAYRQGIEIEILPLPDPWISTQGVGGTNEALAYRKSDKSLYCRIAQPIQKVFTVPSVKDGGSYETLFNGCLGQVQWLRPSTAVYYYGI